MYRICVATSGSYYVQMFNGYEYKKVGPFFLTKQGARNWVKGAKHGASLAPRIVEYC